MCKRLAFQADPKDVSGDRYREACRGGPLPDNPAPTVAALHADRARLVKAVDSIFPKDTLDGLQAYLTSAEILGLYDDDTMSQTIASLGELLQEISTHGDAMDALARRGARDGYRPPGQAIGPAAPLTASPHIRALLQHTLPTLLPGGAAKAEWDALVAALAATFADASPVPAGAVSTSAGIVNDFLLTESPALGDATPLLAVRRDAQGNAVVISASGAGEPPAAPFATTGDTAERDELGRALDPTGAPIYQYFDITKTLLGGLSHDLGALLDPGKSTLVDFVRGASRLLGDRVPATKTFESGATLGFQGYDTAAGSPALDLVHAFTQVLRDPAINDVLDLADTLLRDHEPATARLLEAAVISARYADEHPEAQIVPEAPLWDELRPLLAQILANPTLTRDLLLAMERPETKLVINRFIEQMRFKDKFDVQQTSPYLLTGAFATEVDRSQPDSGLNRSAFARLLHIINDTNGAELCNKQDAVVRDPLLGLPIATYGRCQLFRVTNMAVLYLQSVVYAKQGGRFVCENNRGAFDGSPVLSDTPSCPSGRRLRRKADINFQWGGLVEGALGLLGGDQYIEENTFAGMRTHPTPEGLNRVIFVTNQPPLLQDTAEPPRDKFGALVTQKHPGTLLTWEKNNFFDQIRPILQAFADANQEQLFVDFMATLHKHWPTKDSTSTQHTNPAGPNYTPGSNGVTYEPLVIKVFAGDLWPTLTASAAELNAIRVNGKEFAAVVGGAGRFFTTPLAGLGDRRGVTTTLTADGKPVTTLSPWHLIADAYRGKRARLAAMGPDGALWPESAAEIVDVLIRGVPPAPPEKPDWTFKNRNFVPATLGVTALLRGRLAEYTGAARTTWLAQTLPGKMQDLFAHPVFAATADLLDAQTNAGEARVAIERLLHTAHDPVNSPEAFAIMRTTAADLIQLARDDQDLVAYGTLAGALLAPGKPYLTTQLVFLDKLYRADVASTLTNLVARLFQQHDAAADPGIPALSAVVDGIGDVDRVEPGGTPITWSTADYSSVFGQVSAFLKEEQRGLPRFITIVKERNP